MPAELTFVDPALMLLVVLAATLVEPPQLRRRPRIGRDVHVAPGRRNPQHIDALQIPLVLYCVATRPLVTKSARFRAFTSDPLLRHLLRRRPEISGPRENLSR